MPNPAKMDRRITLQVKTTAQNSYGETIETWSDVAPVWARKVALKGLEKWASQQIQAELHEQFEIRDRDDIAPVNRFVFESKVYDIKSVTEVGRRVGLVLTASVRP